MPQLPDVDICLLQGGGGTTGSLEYLAYPQVEGGLLLGPTLSYEDRIRQLSAGVNL